MNSQFSRFTENHFCSLGDIELKSVSLNDLIKFDELKFYELSGRDFITCVLQNQLIKPKIDLNSFKSLSNMEIEELGKLFIKQEEHYRNLFKDTGEFFIDFKRTFIESRKDLVKQTSKVFRPLLLILKAINPCNKILSKYKWFVTPSFPLAFISTVKNINKEKGRKDKKVNQLYIEYFETNEWKNLEIMVNDWKKSHLLRKRLRILMDCASVVNPSYKNGINAANVILPTLIAQIDGVLSDYLNSRGVIVNSSYKLKKSHFKKFVPIILPTPLNEAAFSIILNILFQESWVGKPLLIPFNFNRHKITHGESIKYGRKDYMIRAFMVLDLLSNL